jgi:hypothetical protein
LSENHCQSLKAPVAIQRSTPASLTSCVSAAPFDG